MRTWPGRVAAAILPASLVGLFFLVPTIHVVVFALGGSGADPTRAWSDLWTQDHPRRRILFTFQQAILSTLLTLGAALPLAHLFAHHDFPGRRLLRALFTAPFVLPALVVAVALQAFLGRGSTLAASTGLDLLALAGPLGAILIAHVYYNVSLVLRIVGGVWERTPPELVESARTLGASRFQSVARVQLPLAVPAILAATALVFLFSLTSFGIILLLGEGEVGTIETLIWENVASFLAHYDRAALLGIVQLSTTLVALGLYLHFRRRTQTAFRPRLDAPRPRLPAWGVAALAIAALFLVGPSVALAAAAFTHQGAPSLEGARLLWSGDYPIGSYDIADAFTNSLVFGLLATLLAVPLALLALWAFGGAHRSRAPWEAFLLSPLGSSPVLLGLGFLLAFDGSPLWDLRAHPARIVVAHVLVAFPFVTRILAPSLDAIDPRLHEAARTLGASSFQVLARVDLPLLAPALRVGAVFAFAASLGEFGATLVLRRPEFTTIPLAIFDALARPGVVYRAQAEVLTFALLVVATTAFWLLEAGSRRGGADIA